MTEQTPDRERADLMSFNWSVFKQYINQSGQDAAELQRELVALLDKIQQVQSQQRKR